jgi:hypothetical protein
MAKGDPVRQIAASLSKVPTNSVEPIGAQFKDIAERHGGRFMRRYKLTGVVAQVYDKGDSVNMILVGKPAGFWAIKSYGRSAVRPIRKKALSTGRGHPFAHAGPAGGNKAWDRAVSDLDRAVPDVVAKVLDRTVK